MAEGMSRRQFEQVTPQIAEQRLQEAGFRPGVPVVLVKVKILPGKNSGVPVGTRVTGVLKSVVKTGQLVDIDGAKSTTSSVKGIDMKNGKYYITTETSEYEIQIDVERRMREGLNLVTLGADLGGLEATDNYGGKGVDGSKLMRVAEDWLPVLATYGIYEGDTVEFFAERPRVGTVTVGRVSGKEKRLKSWMKKGIPGALYQYYSTGRVI